MVLKDPNQLNPEILTEFLANTGLLEWGSVTSFNARPNQSTPFTGKKISHLNLEFSPKASFKAPSCLVLKIGTGPKEVFFYESILPKMYFRITPGLFHAHYDVVSNSSNFLLEDLSESHWQTRWPVPPSLDDCESSLSAIAKLHAFWWNSPFLQQNFQNMLSEGNWWDIRINLAVDRFGSFLDFMGDRLSGERRAVFELVLTSPNQGWHPVCVGAPVTMLHGDAHFWNFLFPNDHKLHPAIMIDWNSWDIGRAADDLAYMMALHWYPERRSRFELSLLEHYYRSLVDSGVSGYGFDALMLDYRHSVIMNLFIPVWQWERGIHPSIWWFHLERAFLAFEDLDCRELLQ